MFEQLQGIGNWWSGDDAEAQVTQVGSAEEPHSGSSVGVPHFRVDPCFRPRLFCSVPHQQLLLVYSTTAAQTLANPDAFYGVLVYY